MRKIEIAHRMHQEAGISEQEAASLLAWILELFKSTLRRGERVSVPKFGVFTVKSKTPRPGRNPRTGEAIMIKARQVVIFHASPQFKAAVSAVQARHAEVLPLKG